MGYHAGGGCNTQSNFRTVPISVQCENVFQRKLKNVLARFNFLAAYIGAKQSPFLHDCKSYNCRTLLYLRHQDNDSVYFVILLS